MSFQPEDPLPQPEMRLDAKETLTKGDKDSKLKDRIGRQLPQLDAIGEEETPKKLVGRQRQPTKKESHEHGSVAFGRSGARFVTGDDDVSIHVGNDAILAQLAFIPRGEGCPLPIALGDGSIRRSMSRRGGLRGGRAGARARRMTSPRLRHGRGGGLLGKFLSGNV